MMLVPFVAISLVLPFMLGFLADRKPCEDVFHDYNLSPYDSRCILFEVPSSGAKISMGDDS